MHEGQRKEIERLGKQLFDLTTQYASSEAAREKEKKIEGKRGEKKKTTV
jgi:hypothetical protein